MMKNQELEDTLNTSSIDDSNSDSLSNSTEKEKPSDPKNIKE